jgi:hypothetical protein
MSPLTNYRIKKAQKDEIFDPELVAAVEAKLKALDVESDALTWALYAGWVKPLDNYEPAMMYYDQLNELVLTGYPTKAARYLPRWLVRPHLGWARLNEASILAINYLHNLCVILLQKMFFVI